MIFANVIFKISLKLHNEFIFIISKTSHTVLGT